MANVMTYAQALSTAINFLNENIQYGDDFSEVVDRLKALQAQLAKRGTKGGMTKTQKANEAIKAVIFDILAEVGGFISMADLLADDRLPEGMTTQKAGALLGQLVKAEKVVRYVYKKRTLYAIAGTEFVAPDAEVAEGEDA